jgi:N-methylhydantoinase B/oxoprolinase/acetone carboxylase alpha subunit
VRHFLDAFGGADAIEEGDILVTNDPWHGTGHLADINLAMPVFHRGRLVAFAASTAHAPDIGGRSGAQRIADVFEEGFQIPAMKLARRGEIDRAILALLRKNVRAPEEVLGDLFGQVAALHLVHRRLLAVLEEWDLPDLDGFAAASFARTDAATRRAIAVLPRGAWTAEEETDGIDGKPIRLCARVEVLGDEIVVDYAGSSPQLPAALNVSWTYAYSFTAYTLKCLLDPESPNNEGSLRAIRMTAPEGSVINHVYPYSGGNRALTGHYLPGLVLAALEPALPEQVIAGVGCPIWSILLRGWDAQRRRFTLKAFFNGGMGASARRDGLSATSWPSNISGTPVEVIEQGAPVRVLRRGLRAGSGGAGWHRGGDGLETVFLLLDGGPYTLGVNAERTRSPARGLAGGGSGATGAVLINDSAVDIKDGPFALAAGDVLTVRTPAGGGHGPPPATPVA